MSSSEIESQLPLVFDASAFIVLLQRERGSDGVRALLEEARTPLYTHALAVCELYTHLIQTQGVPVAHAALEGLKKAGIEVRTEMDSDFWQQAGRFKAIHPFLALSDCFAIGLARRVGGEIVTANHVDFDLLAPLGLCGIRFIR